MYQRFVKFAIPVMLFIVNNPLVVIGLKCATGYRVYDEYLFNESIWNISQCSSDVHQECEKKIAEINGYSLYNISVITGGCVNASQCKESCSLDLNKLLEPNSKDMSEEFIERFKTRHCISTCCSTDNCNEHFRTTIQVNSSVLNRESGGVTSTESFETLPPLDILPLATEEVSFARTTPKTSQQPEKTTSWKNSQASSLQCTQGLEIVDIKSKNFVSDICPPDKNFACMRREVVIKGVPGRGIIPLIGLNCVNETSCDHSCFEMAKQVLENGMVREGSFTKDLSKVTVMSCEQACCQHRNCNIRSVEAIRADRGGSPNLLSNKPGNALFVLLTIFLIHFLN